MDSKTVMLRQQVIIEDYIRAYNNLDVDKMLENLHDEIIYTNSFLDNIDTHTHGKPAFKSQAESIISDFITRRLLILTWTFSGAKVVVDLEYDALLNSAESADYDEQFVDMNGFIEFWFRDFKIVYINSFV
ncbi:nuclear transport factor 2 family protein [Shewanella sp. MBTL60-007]|uniref:nuclear transport factor 2 family protein n=1 Tax=Shewanella sp. MBTL60-007 TaxID=2815911 RepID=UPI001BBC1D88|nr:nuclear transport factor 2 family protein [Shewanella sp. MBTL60-007]GIU32988.1 hypothetical protein TUM3792_45760 [Shewanella sp. MBTL60-007]